MQFSPNHAIDTLRSAAVEIEKYGKELNQLRINHVLAAAKLRDKKQEALEHYFGGKTSIKATELSLWLKFKTHTEMAEEETLKAEIRRIQSLLDTTIETTNTLKFAGRLAHLETNM